MNKYSELSNADLDRAIAERVMGWDLCNCGQHNKPHGSGDKIRPWSSDETTFFRDVVPMMNSHKMYLNGYQCSGNKEYVQWFNSYNSNRPVDFVSNKSLARAGCESALLALDEMKNAKKD